LPEVVKLLPKFPARLLVVGAGDEMWRGGLSGAASLYLHIDRPLISQNGTSPVLHELIHVGSRLGGEDWVVEGLAEYYGLEILRRSRTVNETRLEGSIDRLEGWVQRDHGCIARPQSTGANTARAVLVLRDLDREIRTTIGRRASLDDVIRQLADGDRNVTEASFERIVTEVLGGPSKTLANLPRCSVSPSLSASPSR
jgi:hypothetical protein